MNVRHETGYQAGWNGQLPRRVADLAILCELGEMLNSSVKLDEILNMVLIGVTCSQGLRFNRGFLLLVDEGRRCVRGSHAIGPDDPGQAERVWKELESERLGLTEMLITYRGSAPGVGRRVMEIVSALTVSMENRGHILVRCLEQGGARIASRDDQDDPSIAEVARTLGVDRFALVPVRSRSGPMGVLLADNAITGRAIEPPDLEMLQLFANHAGTAIEKARLYERILEEKHELEIVHTELRRNQQVIIDLQRLSDLGEMAARVAHEIRNPLVTIGGFARRMLERTGGADANHRPLQIIVSEVMRLERILIEVLDYARPLRLNPAEMKLNDLLRQTVEAMTPEAEGAGVDLQLALDESIQEIRADASLVRIALVNLVRNAIQASSKESDTPGRIVLGTKRSGGVAVISVRDNGPGVLPDLGDRIFEPFFTTKPSGSGLGLAITSQILREHGGRVRCESDAEGACFYLDLPIENSVRGNAA